jgi:ParB-like chromosome segregation protein Spo0J
MKRSKKLTTPLQLRVLPIEQLKPAPYNPRKTLKPTDKAYRKLEASIREFGLVEPLIWNERTGHIVGGHARLSILKAMKVREVPVSVVNLTEAREKALNIVLNNQEAQGRYDTRALADLLDELDDLPELDMTGFDAQSRATLRLEPLPDLAELEPLTSGVAVTLEMSEEIFAKVEPKLNALVAEFDLVSHVRHG